MYPPQQPQQPQQPYQQPDPNQQRYAPSPYAQPPYAPQPGSEAYGLPPNPYAPPSMPIQQPNPYAPPSMPIQQPNPYAPPSMPMQQPMYGAPAPMPAPNALNFSAFTLPQNRGNLFAAAGGVVGLICFFVLPYYSVSAGSLGSVSATGSQLAGGTDGASGLLWLIPLCAIVGAAVACIVTFGIRSIQGLTPRNAAYALLGSGAIGTLVCLYTLYSVNSQISQAEAASGVNLSSSGISYGFSFGFWLTLLAMIAVGVGGYLNLRQTQAQPPMMPPYMGGGFPPQMPPMQ